LKKISHSSSKVSEETDKSKKKLLEKLEWSRQSCSEEHEPAPEGQCCLPLKTLRKIIARMKQMMVNVDAAKRS